MNPSILLKSLLPGLVPLAVYVGADALFGERVGLLVGLAVGVLEFAYALVRTRKPDPFVAADTLLLGLAGGLSLLLENDIFFKLKPAILEVVLAAALALLMALPPSYLKGYLGRQLRGAEIPEAAIPAMKRSLRLMLALLAGHAALTVFSAFALSTAAWGFVSGGLLYMLFGAMVIGQLLWARLAARRARGLPARGPRPSAGGEELLPLVDEDGKVIGAAPRSECHRGPGKLHPVVHVHLLDGRGRLCLQKRAATKDIQPGKWDTSVGGHVAAGEDLDAALSRELREELGVTAFALEAAGAKPEPFFRYRWDSELESELVFSFVLRFEGPFATDPAEVEEARFWDIEEVRAGLGKGIFTPNFEGEFAMLEKAVFDAKGRGSA